MLEPRGYCQQNFDGIFSVLPSMTAVQPGSKCKNDKHKGIAHNTDEKKHACWGEPINSNLEYGEENTYPGEGIFSLGVRKQSE